MRKNVLKSLKNLLEKKIYIRIKKYIAVYLLSSHSANKVRNHKLIFVGQIIQDF